MNIKFYYVFTILILIPFTAFGGSGIDVEDKKIAICIAAAKHHLEEFSLNENELTIRCQCVRSRRAGVLPSLLSTWDETGKNSAALTLIECSRQDITFFYTETAYKTAYQRMKKRGLDIERIKRFSVCAGEGGYVEMHRAVASESEADSKLNVGRFRDMYSRCEASVN